MSWLADGLCKCWFLDENRSHLPVHIYISSIADVSTSRFFVLYSKKDTTPNCSDRHPMCRNCRLYPENVRDRTLPNQNAGQRRLRGRPSPYLKTYIADRNFEVTLRFLYWTSLFGRGNTHTRKQSYARTNEFRDQTKARFAARVLDKAFTKLKEENFFWPTFSIWNTHFRKHNARFRRKTVMDFWIERNSLTPL